MTFRFGGGAGNRQPVQEGTIHALPVRSVRRKNQACRRTTSSGQTQSPGIVKQGRQVTPVACGQSSSHTLGFRPPAHWRSSIGASVPHAAIIERRHAPQAAELPSLPRDDHVLSVSVAAMPDASCADGALLVAWQQQPQQRVSFRSKPPAPAFPAPSRCCDIACNLRATAVHLDATPKYLYGSSCRTTTSGADLLTAVVLKWVR